MTLVPSPAAKHALEVAVTAYEQHLPLAEQYLTGRGFTLDSVRPYRLGVIHDPMPGHEYLRGRLAVPYLTKGGVVDVKARCIACIEKCEGHSKYLYVSGTEHRIYNVNAFFTPSQFIVITEGELDAIAVQVYTGLPACAYPGVSSWKPFFSRCFSGFETVFVIADGDDAGVDGAKFVSKEVGRHAAQVQIVRLPTGHDSNSYLHLNGADIYKKALGLLDG